MEFSKDELLEAQRQIDSTLHKLRETIKTFESKENVERYKSQITPVSYTHLTLPTTPYV